MPRTPEQREAYKQRRRQRKKGIYCNKEETSKKQSESQKKFWSSEEVRKKQAESLKKYWLNANLETYEKASEKSKIIQNMPGARLRNSEAQKKRFEDPNVREKHKLMLKETQSKPEVRIKNSVAQKKRFEDPEVGRHLSEAARKYYKDHPERGTKHGETLKKLFLDKQWYGSVTYKEPKKYCVLFNSDFKERCIAYWGNKSVLSSKTRAENGKKNRQLTVHHVYYQKKACCEWDEDLQGYYAMINLGTVRNPNIIRHNIKGDPNKFVVLTNSEHATTNHDKLKWVELFEDLIENQGGKCYFTKEEG